jgi:hypothetical protein
VFTYLLPVIIAVAPASGPLAGGTTVTLTGAGFTGATTVRLTIGTHVMSVPAKVKSDMSLTFVTPSAAKLTGLAAGNITAKLTVVVGSYTSTTSANAIFTYLLPTVTKVSPAAGPRAGATTVTLTGSGLTGATQVRVTVGTHILSVPATVKSDTSLTFLTPSITKLTGLPAGNVKAQLGAVVGSYTSPTSTKAVFTYGP